MEILFHYRVRAVMVKDHKVLLAHVKGAVNTFLPGGHIELGEKAEEALVREIKEELGEESRTTSFLGAVENSWVQNGVRQHEINLIFEVDAPGLDANKAPVSQEDHIEFLWSDINDLDKNNLLPPSLESHIKSWLGGDKKVWWASHFT